MYSPWKTKNRQAANGWKVIIMVYMLSKDKIQWNITDCSEEHMVSVFKSS